MSEIVLNGTKLWDGTVAEQSDKGSWLITPPGGTQYVAVGDLVIDGIVVNGPHAGWKFETRQVGIGVGKSSALLKSQIPGRQLPGGLLRDCWYKGKHGERCEKTEEGWICRDFGRGCTVTDLPTEPRYTVTVDTLDEVVSEIERKRFRIHWTISRHSHRVSFTNGRAILPRDETVSREVWFSGRTWTKWGARRQIRKTEKRERDRLH